MLKDGVKLVIFVFTTEQLCPPAPDSELGTGICFIKLILENVNPCILMKEGK